MKIKISKDSRKKLIVLFIVVIFFGSSLAFIIFEATQYQVPSTQATKIPDNMVVDGRLSNETVSQLYQNGYTIMEFHYYENCCPDIISTIESLPSELQYQILVQKIKDNPAGQAPWVDVRSIYGNNAYNITGITEIIPPLCKVLVKPPMECGLINQG